MALVPDDSTQRNALLIGVAVVVAFYFGFWDRWYTPKQEELQEMETRLEQLEDQNRSARILATRGGEELQQRLALYERHVMQLEQLIPQSEEVPELLNDMSTEARRAGVEVATIRPEPSEPGAYYTRRSYQVEVVGAYHDVGEFLTSVASLSRIITPVDMSLSSFGGGSDVVEAENPLQASFRIETYVVPSGPSGADTASGQGQGPSSGAGGGR
jgi:type IV pilus assembly protein PilO